MAVSFQWQSIFVSYNYIPLYNNVYFYSCFLLYLMLVVMSLYIAPPSDGFRYYLPLSVMLLQQANKSGFTRS